MDNIEMNFEKVSYDVNWLRIWSSSGGFQRNVMKILILVDRDNIWMAE
jgi:hypothetical protein